MPFKSALSFRLILVFVSITVAFIPLLFFFVSMINRQGFYSLPVSKKIDLLRGNYQMNQIVK